RVGVGSWTARADPRHGLEIDRAVLADRGMRAAAGLDADDALQRERLVAHQELRVFLGVDVVRHARDAEAVAQLLAQRERQRGLAGSHRSSDADAQSHDLKSREYCVSCRPDSTASAGANLQMY